MTAERVGGVLVGFDRRLPQIPVGHERDLKRAADAIDLAADAVRAAREFPANDRRRVVRCLPGFNSTCHAGVQCRSRASRALGISPPQS